jgi:S1-C subfamily serine protease/HEAT repeat protein
MSPVEGRIKCPRCGFDFALTPPPLPTGGPAAAPQTVRPELLSLDDEPVPARQKNRRAYAIVGAVAVLLICGAVAAWQVIGSDGEPEAAEQAAKDGKPPVPANPTVTAEHPVLTGEQVNARLLQSAVFIISRGGRGGGVGVGSGALIHRGRRLVITNYHVVEDNTRVVVLFPEYSPTGELITDLEHYAANAVKLGTEGTVVSRDPKADLALVEIKKVPVHSEAVPLARSPAVTGSTVYSIGGSGAEAGALWRLSTGTVRGRHRHVGRYRNGQAVDATVLETQSPVNPGDSGGPTVNDRCELVGVVAAFDQRERLVSYSIDLSEVRSHLKDYAKRNGWTWEDSGPVVPDSDLPADPVTVAKVESLVDRAKKGERKDRLEAIRRLGEAGADARSLIPQLIEVLDDPDELIRKAMAAALEQIGPPAKVDEGFVAAALNGPGKGRRLYALRYYGRVAKASREQLPALVKELNDADAAVREAAAAAISFYGPDAKPLALAAILKHTQDPDPVVASTANKVFTSFAPYNDSDRKIFVDHLVDPEPRIRVTAINLLASLTPDGSTARQWFEPRLIDVAADVREAAVLGLAKWGADLKRLAPTMLKICRDENHRVQVAALRALGKMDPAAEFIPEIIQYLNPMLPPAIRDAAARTLLEVRIPGPAKALSVLETLLKFEDPTIKSAAFDRAASLGSKAKSLLPQILGGLKAEDTKVQKAALKLAAVLGPDAESVLPVAADILKKSADAPQTSAVIDLQVQSVKTLSSFGTKSADALAEALGQMLPFEVHEEICKALGGLGADAPDSVIMLLFLAADRRADLRSTLTDALGHISGDRVSAQLRDRTIWRYRGTGRNREKTTKYSADVQLWAIRTMGQLDPDRLSEKERALNLEWLKDLVEKDPDENSKSAARASLAKLSAAGKDRQP